MTRYYQENLVTDFSISRVNNNIITNNSNLHGGIFKPEYSSVVRKYEQQLKLKQNENNNRIYDNHNTIHS